MTISIGTVHNFWNGAKIQTVDWSKCWSKRFTLAVDVDKARDPWWVDSILAEDLNYTSIEDFYRRVVRWAPWWVGTVRVKLLSINTARANSNFKCPRSTVSVAGEVCRVPSINYSITQQSTSPQLAPAAVLSIVFGEYNKWLDGYWSEWSAASE